MTLKETRIKSGITVKEVLEAYPDKRVDKSLFSKIENGIVPYPVKLADLVLKLCGKDFVGRDNEPRERSVATAEIDILNAMRNKKCTRAELCAVTGLDDRAVRHTIGNLQKKGYIIINNQDGKGYYITSDIEEILRHYRQERKRAISRLSALKYERKILREVGIL